MRTKRLCHTAVFVLVLSLQALFIAAPSGATMIVMQPGPEGKDTHVCNLFGYSDLNFGDYEMFEGMGLITNTAAFIEFDLSSIPAGATIDSATVTLWARYMDGQINFEPLVWSWDEMSVTYNNQPGASGDQISHPISRGDPSGPCYWGCAWAFDITGIVSFWMENANYGLKVAADTPGYGWVMASSDNLTYDRPALTVWYTEKIATESTTWGRIKGLSR